MNAQIKQVTYNTKLANSRPSKTSKEEVVDMLNTFEMIPAERDGNCFFHSVLGALGPRLPIYLQKLKIRERVKFVRQLCCLMLEKIILEPDPYVFTMYNDFLQKGLIYDELFYKDMFNEAAMKFGVSKQTYIQERKAYYLQRSETLDEICQSNCKKRPLAKKIFEQYLLMVESDELKEFIEDHHQTLQDVPKWILSEEEKNAKIINKELTVEYLLYYIYDHSLMGTFIDLPVFGIMISEIFRITIKYAYPSGGVFCFAQEPITSLQGEAKFQIHIVQHTPYKHFDYFEAKPNRELPYKIHEVTHLDYKKSKDLADYTLPMEIVPKYFNEEELNKLIYDSVCPQGLNTNDLGYPKHFILTAKDVSVPVKIRRNFIVGEFYYVGKCATSEGIYYSINMENVRILTQQGSTGIPNDNAIFSRIVKGIIFLVGYEHHENFKPFWISSTVNLIGVYRNDQVPQKNIRKILHIKEAGNENDCIFYVPSKEDMPDAFILEIFPSSNQNLINDQNTLLQ